MTRSRRFSLGAGFAAIFLLAGLTSCATPKRTEHQHVATTGYVCTVGEPFNSSSWAVASVSETGVPHEIRWQWQAKVDAPGLLRVTVAGSERGTVTPDQETAYGSVAWAFHVPKSRDGDRHRIEVTTTPSTHLWTMAPFASDFSRNRDISVMSAWPELLAFVEGARSLEAVIRSRDGAIVLRHAIDPTVIASAKNQLAELFRKTASVAADYRSRCSFTDDLEPNVILV